MPMIAINAINVMDSSKAHHLRLPTDMVDSAIRTAWPSYVHSLEDKAVERMRNTLEDAQRKVERLEDTIRKREDIIDGCEHTISIERTKSKRLEEELREATRQHVSHKRRHDDHPAAETITRRVSPPTPGPSPSVELLLPEQLVPHRYLGEGDPLPHGDPLISVTGRIPRPLGKQQPSTREWYHVCPTDDPRFRELLQQARNSLHPTERSSAMNTAFKRLREEKRTNPKLDCIRISKDTPADIVQVLHLWRHNPEGIPAAIREEPDGTLSTTDIDVWAWIRKIAPGSKTSSSFRAFRDRLAQLFSVSQQWEGLVDEQDIQIPMGDTLRASVTMKFPVRDRQVNNISLQEIAEWLAKHGGITPDRAQRVEGYVQRTLSGVAYNEPARGVLAKAEKLRAAKSSQAPWPAPGSKSTLTIKQLDKELLELRLPQPEPNLPTPYDNILMEDADSDELT